MKKILKRNSKIKIKREKNQRQMVKGMITFKVEMIFKCAFGKYNPLAQ